MNIQTRSEAREDGATYYFTGKACLHGHIGLRFVSTGSCADCIKKRTTQQVEAGYFKQQYTIHKDAILARQKQTYPVRRAANIASAKKWAEDNPAARRLNSQQYKQRKRASSPSYVLSERLRARIRAALSHTKCPKTSSTEAILGCSFTDFKVYIESKFTAGMSWERLSEIHIDHIIPLASARTEAEVLTLCHYSNLQPLWAVDNLRKWAHMPDGTIA
jgi:hypothetical protein